MHLVHMNMQKSMLKDAYSSNFPEKMYKQMSIKWGIIELSHKRKLCEIEKMEVALHMLLWIISMHTVEIVFQGAQVCVASAASPDEAGGSGAMWVLLICSYFL